VGLDAGRCGRSGGRFRGAPQLDWLGAECRIAPPRHCDLTARPAMEPEQSTTALVWLSIPRPLLQCRKQSAGGLVGRCEVVVPSCSVDGDAAPSLASALIAARIPAAELILDGKPPIPAEAMLTAFLTTSGDGGWRGPERPGQLGGALNHRNSGGARPAPSILIKASLVNCPASFSRLGVLSRTKKSSLLLQLKLPRRHRRPRA